MLEKVVYKEKDYCSLEINDNVEECKKYWVKTINVKDHESNTGYYDIMKCEKCGISFTNPYPTEETVKYLYMDRDTTGSDEVTNVLIDNLKEYFSKIILKKLSGKFFNKKSLNILDFGCGNGRHTLAASSVFKDSSIDAVDFQDNPPTLIRNSKKNNIKYLSYNSFIVNTQQYDLILLRHVLEHIHYPVQFLQMLSSHLSQDGFIYIELPNLDSGYNRFFKKYSILYYVPRHLHHFTPKSLKNVISQAGMKSLIGRAGQPSIGSTLKVILGLKKRNIFLQFLGIILHPLQMFLEFIHGSSTCLSAIAYKKNEGTIAKENSKNL